MRLGISDHKVIRDFVDQKPNHNGVKLDTDGSMLDGLWLGGRGIAAWHDDQICFSDLGSKSGDAVQRAVRGHASPYQLADYDPRKHAGMGPRGSYLKRKR